VALGASIGSLRSAVTLDALRLVSAGVATGLAAAAAGTRMAGSVIPWAGAVDFVALAAAGALMIAAAGLASYLPARAATRADPARVLRAES
jgi:ABC-type antimicrobial peptide transport system permease subunit